MAISAPINQQIRACGPPIVARIAGTVINGPVPTMLEMLMEIALSRPNFLGRWTVGMKGSSAQSKPKDSPRESSGEASLLVILPKRLVESSGLDRRLQQESVIRARPLPLDQAGTLVSFTRQEVGWEWMSFVVTRLLPGQTLELRTADGEMVLVWLGGSCIADWGVGPQSVGGRKSVFDGLPYALYLPVDHRVTLKAETICEIAECRVPSRARLEPRLVTPA